MADVPIIGSYGELVAEGEGFDLQSGRYFTKTYKGTRTFVNGIIASAGNLLSYDSRQVGALFEITVRLPHAEGQELPQFEYRVEPIRAMKSLFSPEVAAIAGISTSNRKLLQKAIQNPGDFATAEPAFTGTAEEQETAQELWHLYLDGVDGREFVAPSLIVTVTAGPFFTIADNLRFWVGRIYTSAQVRDEVNPTLNARKMMPESATDDQPLSAAISERWRHGWLKHQPQLVSVAGGKQALVIQYDYGLWNYLMYRDR